jgi:tetratricopeptide (TPR) repeat protein
MKISILVLSVLLTVSLSLCWANNSDVEKAYNLLYQGKVDTAIEFMEVYVNERPNAEAYYFLGYAYYEKKQMDKANEYFSKAFKLKSFYSPMDPSKN